MSGVFEIDCEEERAVEQCLLGFDLAHAVAVPVLIGISRIPLEALQPRNELVEDSHASMYMTILYACQALRASRVFAPSNVSR